jgi:monovalent cation:H+ antiporter-2, CPA2 family
MHAAEFGVVMMLFLIGLELNPQSFWNMRKTILGFGLSQVLLTSLLLAVLFFAAFGFSIQASIAIALAMSMSSTAIALQTLKEKGLGNTQAGQSSFAVLLLQDISVIPILAILPLMASGGQAEAAEHKTLSPICPRTMPPW